MKIHHWKKLLSFNYSFADIVDYFRANYRYQIFYSNYRWLMRNHIREQIEYRITVMDRECYNNGSCKICGCKTTHLQMANKACEGNCYRSMMNKKAWEMNKNE